MVSENCFLSIVNNLRCAVRARAVATLNDQLGAAREKIPRLSGRACFDPGTVSVLNATGVLDALPLPANLRIRPRPLPPVPMSGTPPTATSPATSPSVGPGTAR